MLHMCVMCDIRMMYVDGGRVMRLLNMGHAWS